jgi:hypothetical protein
VQHGATTANQKMSDTALYDVLGVHPKANENEIKKVLIPSLPALLERKN